MLLKIVFFLCAVSLFLVGCKQVNIVTDELSKEYLSSRDFFNDEYVSLKKNDVLFYIETGYVKKDGMKLIVFLNFDSLYSGVVLKKAEFIGNNVLYDSVQDLDLYSEEESVIEGQKIYSGGARLEFNLQRKEYIPNKGFLIRTYFLNGSAKSYIDMFFKLEKKNILPV